MKLIETKKQQDNALFERKELELVVEAESTPSRKDVLEFLSKNFSANKDNIMIKGIIGKFGSREFEIKANIYKDSEDKEKIETKKKKDIEAKKRRLEAAEKSEEEVKEEKPEENKEVKEDK